MTKSEHPNGAGANHGQPLQPQSHGQLQGHGQPQNHGQPQIHGQPQNQGHPANPAQPGVGGYVQDPQQMVPSQQPVAGQYAQPGMAPPATGEYVPPQAPPATHAPIAGQPPQVDPAYAQQQTPVDDYQYPQGQSVLPEVPPVAVPPEMALPAAQGLQVPPPQAPNTAFAPQPGEGGYGDPAAINSAGEQISQRLAQLQNQYDDELSSGNWDPAHNAPQVPVQNPPLEPAQPVEAYGGYQPPVGDPAAYPPMQAEVPSQQGYQQPPQQSWNQVPEGYQEPQPPAYSQPPVAGAQPGEYAEQGETPDSLGQHFGQTDGGYSNGPSIAQELPSGGGLKKVMLGGAFVAALAVGGGAAYTYQYTDLLGGHTAGQAPTIKATNSPIRILKKKIAGAKGSINKAMHSRLGGGVDNKSGATIAGGREMAIKKAASSAKRAKNKVASAGGGMLAGLENGSGLASTRANAPRRVKTLIVRPDGTILRPAGDDSAGSMVSNAANVAIGPGINAASIPKAGNGTKTSGNKIRRMKTIGEASIARRVEKTAGKSQTRQVIRKIRTINAKKVKTVAPKTVRRASVTVPAPVAGDIGIPFVVQVTSRSSQTGALAAFADMQQKYPSLIGAYAPDIQRADLGAKGVWYRLRVGPVGSKVAASDLCSSLKQAGHPGCFVRKK